MQESTQELKDEKTVGESAPANGPDFEALFPLEGFRDTIILILKTSSQQPIHLEIFGDAYMARVAKSGGIHEFVRANGNAIVFDGHDVLWAERITAKTHREIAIANAKVELARAEKEAAKEKTEAEDKVKAEEAWAQANAIKKGDEKGPIRWFGVGGRRR